MNILLIFKVLVFLALPLDTILQDENEFETLLWQRLQALSNLDAKNYNYDNRVNSDPSSDKFSFSLKEEAFFIVGLHPQNNRISRRFKYPTLIFNPHQQFEVLRQKNCFEKIKKEVRKRDEKISGNINSMLNDYGLTSETAQYSGKQHDPKWQCPLKIKNPEII